LNKKRIAIAVAVLVLIFGLVLGVDFWQRSQVADLPAGSVPIYIGNKLIGGFTPDDLGQLEQVTFKDAEEGKTQEGWLLSEVLLKYVDPDSLQPDTEVTVSSSSREKSETLAWAEIEDDKNMVMFDLSGRGTLKLVAQEGTLRAREKWVQDVDRIEIR